MKTHLFQVRFFLYLRICRGKRVTKVFGNRIFSVFLRSASFIYINNYRYA